MNLPTSVQPVDGSPAGAETTSAETVGSSGFTPITQLFTSDRLEALWILLVETGARIGELLALRWKALDEREQSIYIEARKIKVSEK